MKETGTGYLRNLDAPNLRLQDGFKELLLCPDCEQSLSVREGYFASQLFKPVLDGKTNVHYDERLVYFVVSLLWRVLHRCRIKMEGGTSKYLPLILEVERDWRVFLLDPHKPQKFGHLHIFIADIAEENPPGVLDFNLYCLRAIDASIFEFDDGCYVIAKFARFFFVGIITPYVESQWQNTRIQNGAGVLQLPQTILDVAFGGWMRDRAKFIYETFQSRLSPKQHSTIRNHVHQSLPAMRKSDLLRAASADIADEHRIRSKSGRTGRNDKCPCGSGIKFKKCHGR